MLSIGNLAGGLEQFGTSLWMCFHSVGFLIIPTDDMIFFRGVESTNQMMMVMMMMTMMMMMMTMMMMMVMMMMMMMMLDLFFH